MKVLDTIPYREGNAVVLSCDKNYMDYAIVAMQSWLDVAKMPTCLTLLTDEDDVEEMQAYISSNLRLPVGSSFKAYNVNLLFDFEGQPLYEHGYLTKAMYYRLLIPDIMPSYSRVVYLDCDTCTVKSIEEMFQLPMEEHEVIAGVAEFEFARVCTKWIKGSKGVPKEFHDALSKKYGTFENWYAKELGIHFSPNLKYMNSGMFMLDIAKCNAYGFTGKCMDLVSDQMQKNGWIYFPDQDVLNSTCNGKIKWLPSTWNVLWYFCTNYVQRIAMHRKGLQKEAAEYKATMEKSACLWHYVAKKPWHRPYFNYDVAAHWWRACSHTPLFEKHLSRLSPTVREHVLESIEDRKAPTLDQFL